MAAVCAQVAIVLFRTLSEFYSASLGWSTLPLMVWRFGTIGIGSLCIGALAPRLVQPSQCPS